MLDYIQRMTPGVLYRSQPDRQGDAGPCVRHGNECWASAFYLTRKPPSFKEDAFTTALRGDFRFMALERKIVHSSSPVVSRESKPMDIDSIERAAPRCDAGRSFRRLVNAKNLTSFAVVNLSTARLFAALLHHCSLLPGLTFPSTSPCSRKQ